MNKTFHVGQKVIKTAGNNFGSEVKIKAIFEPVSEAIVENWTGHTEKVAFDDIKPTN